jgi:hypothetical protein
MTCKGTIKEIQGYNQKYLQPDSNFEFIDNILVCIVHADPECTGSLSIQNGVILFHIQPSNLEFKANIINNLVKLNSLLKIKIVFSSSLAISKVISFHIHLT